MPVAVNPDDRRGPVLPFGSGSRVFPASTFGLHGTRTANESPSRSAARRVGRPGRGSRSCHLAVPRWAGRGRCCRGHGWSFGVRVPVGDWGGGGCAIVAGPSSGSGHRGRFGDPRSVADLDVVDGDPQQRHTGGRRIRPDRSGHRRGLCGERSAEARRGRGASLPCVTRRRRNRRGMPRSGGLVVPEQPRHPGRRPGRRSRRAAAPPRRDHAAVGRSCRAAACAGGRSLPARCARRRDARRHCRGRGAARVHAPCPKGGITAGKAEAE